MMLTGAGPTHQPRATACITRAVLFGLLMPFCSDGADAASFREEHHCLALSLYWEARGEGRRGMIAVGWTILNRVHSEEFPATPCEVAFQGGERPPCEFSWYCDGKSDKPRDRHSWHLALIIASELLLDPPPDPTGGSLFYHSSSIRSAWHRRRIQTAQIGRHVFYR